MLTVVTWRWGDKWGPEYFTRLAAGFARQLSQQHRFAVISGQPPINGAKFEQWEIPAQDWPLVEARGCFARMRIFDAVFQSVNGVKVGDRIVNADADVVPTQPALIVRERTSGAISDQRQNAVDGPAGRDYPRLSVGGALIVDDYGHWQGSRAAVGEYFADKPIALQWIDKFSVMARKCS